MSYRGLSYSSYDGSKMSYRKRDSASSGKQDRKEEASQLREEQTIDVLCEHAAGAKAADLARRHGVSKATPYNWKGKFGGMDISEAKRLLEPLR
ncbi:transposase [Tardiphaga robiniae]|nr:transposase [Tardiphaga robiniae]